MILIIKHDAKEGPGTINEFLAKGRYQFKEVDLSLGEVLPDPDNCGGIVSMGGAMNVYQEREWPFLIRENEFLKEAVKKRIPVIGICLGAQLLAKCAGARVTKAIQKEMGWHKVRLTDEADNDPLFKGFPEVFDVFQWHEDTFDVPEGGTLLATGTTCMNQAMRIGECAWALQFHPEMTTRMIEEWGKTDTHMELSKRNLMCKNIKIKGSYKKHADILCANFMNIVTNRRS